MAVRCLPVLGFITLCQGKEMTVKKQEHFVKTQKIAACLAIIAGIVLLSLGSDRMHLMIAGGVALGVGFLHTFVAVRIKKQEVEIHIGVAVQTDEKPSFNYTMLSTDTIAKLKDYLQRDSDIEVRNLKISGCDSHYDSSTLAQCGIDEGSHLSAEVIWEGPIYVRTLNNGPVITIEVRSDETIDAIKGKLIAKCPSMNPLFRIVYAGKRLENEQTLASCGIKKEATLQIAELT